MPYAYAATSVLCEPVQSKCTWTCHKRHFVRSFSMKMPNAYPATPVLCEPVQSKCTWTCHKRHFVRKFSRKMANAYLSTIVLCEPAQSKCTWTCRKRHFAQKCTGKMPDASDTSIEQLPLTVTARTPQCGLSVWGIFHSYVSVQEGSHLSVLLVGSTQLGSNQPTTSHILLFFAGEASGVCPNTFWTCLLVAYHII